MNFKTFLLCGLLGASGAALAAAPAPRLIFSTSDVTLQKRAQVLLREWSWDGTAAGLRREVERLTRELSLRAVQVEEEGGGLVFYLTPYPTLAELAVLGHPSLGEKVLSGAMGLDLGQVLGPGDVSQAEQKARDFLAGQGFAQAEARLQCREEVATSQVRCALEVREGPATRTGPLYLAGARSAREQEEWRARLEMATGKPFRLQQLQQGLERLKKDLRAAGFRRCRIDPPQVTFDPQGQAQVLVVVDKGPVMRLHFSGNRGLSDRDSTLREWINWDSEEKFSAAYFEEAVEGLTRHYLQRGYLDARVLHQLYLRPESGEEEHQFLISVGPHIELPPPHFSGNLRRGERELCDFWRHSGIPALEKGDFVEESLAEGVTALENNYRAEGFLAARVELKKLAVDRVTRKAVAEVQIEEGPQTLLERLLVTGNRALASEEILDILGPEAGQPLRLAKLEAKSKEVMRRYRERGYLYAEGRLLRQFSADRSRAQVILQIEEGPEIRFGEVFLQGNHYTRPEVIRRELLAKPGEVFSAEKIARSQENLQRLGIFRSVEIRPLDYGSADYRRDLLIKVYEKKHTALRFRVGFGSEEGVRGMGEVSLVNLGGTARIVTSRAEVSNRVLDHSDLLERKILLLYREPRLLGNFFATDYDFGGRFNLLYAKEQLTGFRLDRLAFTLGIDRDFTRHIKGTLFWDLEYRQPYDIQDPKQIIDPLDQERVRLGSLGALWVNDDRDDFLNTQRGWIGQVEANLYQQTFVSEADFYRVKVSNNFFLPLYRRFRFALALRAGFSGTFGRTREQGSTLIPLEKRFRLGGADSLRGFKKDAVGGEGTAVGTKGNQFALGGNCMFNYMSELIVPLYRSLEFVAFQDGGEAWLDNRDFNPFDIRTTAGVGLRYVTPVGPLRVDWGYVLDHRAGEDRWQIHFAVGIF